MASPEGPPLSLRPFPVADKAPKNLADFIARVNTQPGGFRDVTEAKLRDEIKSREILGAGDSDTEDVDMSDAVNDDDQAKDPSLARMEVLRNIECVLIRKKQCPHKLTLLFAESLAILPC